MGFVGVVERFIPAHAGNSSWAAWSTSTAAVHPRARGEQSRYGRSMNVIHGSSPRTRGTDDGVLPSIQIGRFIPAHAGNRFCRARVPCCLPVHPRARGEQLTSAATNRRDSGSSPRTRGTGVKQMPNPREERFIPAHAGNRMPPLAGRPLTTVHPRARGEQLQVHHSRVWDAGSSPRTRGTVNLAIAALKAARFIPAHAGNRTRESWPVWSRTVHPRARGEQEHGAFTAKRSHGSSPRTRGTGSATGMRSR